MLLSLVPLKAIETRRSYADLRKTGSDILVKSS